MRNALDGPQHRLLDRVPGEAKARAYLDGHAEIARGVASDQDVANALLAVAAARLLRAYGPEAARRKLEAASATLRGAVASRAATGGVASQNGTAAAGRGGAKAVRA